MKILFIDSSYRKNGNTQRILNRIEESLISQVKEDVLEIEHIFLNNENISNCRGCRICFDQGESHCPCADNIMNIDLKMIKADGIILASPVYVEDVNGMMKNWIDRMAYHCHRPAFFGKPAVLITTSGAGSSSHALRTMQFSLTSWGFTIALKQKIKMGAKMSDDEIKAAYQKEIDHTAFSLLKFFRTGKAKDPSFYSLMVFKIQQRYYMKRSDEDTYDMNYWKENGWINKKNTYYMPHSGNPIKVIMTRTVGGLLALFFA